MGSGCEAAKDAS
jgi:magnesium-transporting ATPase (P-type)